MSDPVAKPSSNARWIATILGTILVLSFCLAGAYVLVPGGAAVLFYWRVVKPAESHDRQMEEELNKRLRSARDWNDTPPSP
jgi:hypothetical protein